MVRSPEELTQPVSDPFTQIVRLLKQLSPPERAAVVSLARGLGALTGSSTERVRRHRAKRSGGLPPPLLKPVTETVTETVPETVTETVPRNGSRNVPDSVVESSSKIFEVQQLRDNAKIVLSFLNEKTGRNYRAVDTNLKLIEARLRSGASVQVCKSLVAKKVREWENRVEMEPYLRPATLFNATKFEQYLGEIGAEVGS